MKRSAFNQMLINIYDEATEDDRITQIDTMTKIDYSPLDMREDEVSFDELVFQSTEPTVGFKGKYAFLSNMAYAPFEMKGHWFLTAEHAFHFWKCKYAEDAKRFEAGNPDCIQNPYDARREGRKVEMRDNWKDIRVRVMTAIVRAKFEQNEYLMEKLKATPGALCEYNEWGDAFWGKTKKDGRWVGENHLGIILSQIRDEAIVDDWMEEEDININF